MNKSDFEHIKQIVKKSGSSFYLPMLFLCKEKKEAMFAIYAFCRQVDDIVDETEDKQIAQQELNKWKQEIENLYNNSPTNAITRTLFKYKNKFNLQKQYFDEIILGMEADINEVLRPDMQSFEKYCYKVASCVGLLSIGVFGNGNINDEIEQFAIELGHALQTTNIIRDIEEDTERGRIYIPIEILEKYNSTDINPSELCKYEKLPQIKEELGAIAYEHFKNAWQLFPTQRKKEFYPAMLMGRIYNAYLDKMKKQNWQQAGCKMTSLEKICAIC